jgi:hypothetical protein
MNKLFIPTISGILVIMLISSCAIKKLYENSLNMDPGSGSIKDKNGFTIPLKIKSFPIDIIPPSSGVQFYRDGIVFLSESKNEGKMVSGHTSFGTAQAYYAPVEDTTLGQRITFSPRAPFLYPCEALSFSNDFGTMYFTKKSEKDNLEKIFRAENFIIGEDKQQWTFDTEPMEFCKEESKYSHPSISVDGSIMIFASDNPESAGGMDLFITRNESMKWSEPENLGNIINTTGNEIFPALDRKNNLFFSSNGLPGYGGYDIFICRYNGNGWDSPIGMTKYINTKNDEYAFSIDRISGKSAFFTSRKTSKSAKAQLYRISLNGGLGAEDNMDLEAILYNLAAAEVDSSEVRIKAKKLEAERMRADSIELARIEAERIKAMKIRADSIENTRLNAQSTEAARIKAVKMKADSIEAAMLLAKQLEEDRIRAAKQDSASIQSAMKIESERLEAERLKAAKIKADSLLAAKKEADRIEAEKMRLARLRADSIEASRLQALKIENPDIVIYKVQFLSTVKSKGKFNISVNGQDYTVFEYFHLGEYRYTIGEFSTLKPAAELQNACREAGYPQAFVAAFKNKVRSTDPVLFK